MPTNIFTCAWKSDGKTVYALNKNETNIFSFNVQPGRDDNGDKTDEKTLEKVACLAANAADLFVALETLLDSIGAISKPHKLLDYMSKTDADFITSVYNKA